MSGLTWNLTAISINDGFADQKTTSFDYLTLPQRFSGLLKESEKIAERINSSRKRFMRCMEILVESSASGVNGSKRTEEINLSPGVSFNYDFQVLTSLYPIPKLIHNARTRTEQAPTFSAFEDFFDPHEIQREYTYPNGLYVLWLIEHREKMKANNKRRRLRRLTRMQQGKGNANCIVNKKLSLRVSLPLVNKDGSQKDTAAQEHSTCIPFMVEGVMADTQKKENSGVESVTIVDSRGVSCVEPGMDVNLQSPAGDSALFPLSIPPPPPPPPPLPSLTSFKSSTPTTSEIASESHNHQRSNIEKIFDEMKGVVLQRTPKEKVQPALRFETPRDQLMEEIRAFESVKLRKAEAEHQSDFKTIVSNGPIDILKMIELHQDSNSTDTWSDDSDDDGW